MRLNINHTSHYSYDTPLEGLVQSHRLTPSKFEGQKVVSWAVRVFCGSREAMKGAEFIDGAGDRIQGWNLRGQVAELTVQVTGEVETFNTAGVLRGHREAVRPDVYLRETVMTEPDAAIVALGQAVREAAGPDPLALAHAVAAKVAQVVRYTPGATDARTSAKEALAIGEGVCQDHAHVVIATARSIGLPARYVSGYLYADSAGVAHEAAHAWAEIWVEGLGWVGFDAANFCCPDERYIRLGSGFDAADAAPIRGVSRGRPAAVGEHVGAGEKLEVSVAVHAAEQ